MTRLAAVALSRPFSEPLHYLLPDGMNLEPGELVEVPLQSIKEVGCVVEIDPPHPPAEVLYKLRPIVRKAAPGYQIVEEIRRLAQWIADYYCCGIGEALASASMIGFSNVKMPAHPHYRVARDWRMKNWTARQFEVLKNLEDEPYPFKLSEGARTAATTSATLKKIAEAGGLDEALPPGPSLPPPDVPPMLLSDQRVAVDTIEEARQAGRFQVFLLHGVTGSGKTEVYLRLIKKTLEDGKSALCLVPEISLTPQTVERFSRRFQSEIGVFHSQMSRLEKRVLYEKIRRGIIRIVIGARSAVFAPLPDLGLVVIDEEHESSYKQGETPRYHARDTAIMRALNAGVPVVLGSATPSFESYENAMRGKYHLLELPNRPANLLMPEVKLVALGKAAAEEPEGPPMLSQELREAIRKRLDAGEQSLLFLNRRGFSNFLFCPGCKWVARCEEDDIALTVHRRRMGPGGRRKPEGGELDLFVPEGSNLEETFLKCHFCGQTHSTPRECPKCGAEDLYAIGSGTQRVEESLKTAFPDERILRLDQDAVGSRRAFLRAWQEMVSGEAHIILGTQMIAKGLHLEQVTLVGVLLADVGLFLPDFRAEERTFSLLMQVSGRTGRTAPGEVIVQTYMPHHPSIQLAAKHDYKAFFESEMRRRTQLRFPPVQRLIAVTLSDKDLGRSREVAGRLGGILRRVRHQVNHKGAFILGPRTAPLERLGGLFRQRLLIRGPDSRANARMLRLALADSQWRLPSTTKLTVDVDPLDLL